MGVGLKVLVTGLAPILKPTGATAMNHLISINSGAVWSKGLMNNKRVLYSGNSKSFRSSVPATRDKDQMYIFYYITRPKNALFVCLAAFKIYFAVVF